MMNAFIDKACWHDVFEGYDIVDIAVQQSTILHLCARKSMSQEEASHLFDQDIPTRFISVYTDGPEGDNCGLQELSGMGYPKVGVSRKPFPIPTGMVSAMNIDGNVWPRGSGHNGPLEPIAVGKWPAPGRLKCLGGYTYSVGVGRQVYKRVEVGKWVAFMDGFPTPKRLTTKLGFNDIDAFSPSDMYAVGGNGDVWHFNGAEWRQMGFPTNEQLATVTCASNGNVYISGEGGKLWIGEKSTWKSLCKGSSSILWNDVLWFQDKLWLASDYQFRQLNGNNLVSVTYEGEALPIFGRMDAYDGLLAIASLETVMSFDGEIWRDVVAPYLD